MKVLTRKTYQERINAALKFIEGNINEDKSYLSLSAIASETNYAKEHIHRILKAYLHESVGQYIKRLKVEKAAKQLLFTKDKITTIAYQSGFSGIEPFSKAFKQIIGVSPSKFRKSYNVFPDIKRPDILNITTDKELFESKLVKFGSVRLLCCRSIGSYNDLKVEKTWENLLAYCNEKQLIDDFTRYYGIVYDDTEITEESRQRYDACVTVPASVKSEYDFFTKEVPRIKVQEFYFNDDYYKLDAFYDKIFLNWFPFANVELSDFPIIEQYLNNSEITPDSKIEAKLFIPLK